MLLLGYKRLEYEISYQYDVFENLCLVDATSRRLVYQLLHFGLLCLKLLSAKVTLYSIRRIIFYHFLSFFHSKSMKSIGKGNKMPKTFRIFAEILIRKQYETQNTFQS